MKTVGLSQAKSQLSDLIDGGEIVAITKRGRPVATLMPTRQNPANVAARIRANPCIDATAQEIVTLVREGRSISVVSD